MHEILKVRLDLLKDLEKFLKKEKVKYYVSGDILINILCNYALKNECILFEVNVCSKKIKSISSLNVNGKIVREYYDSNGELQYYKYMNKNTLFYDCNDLDNDIDKGIFIKINVNSKDYKEYKDVKLDGYNFRIPKDLDKVLEEQYGLGYKYLEERIEKFPKNIVWSSIIPYEQYLKNIEKNNYKIDKQLFLNYEELLNKESKYKKIVDKYRNIVLRTDVRFKLLKKYENKKANILKLYSLKKYKELELVLKDYLIQIKKFYDLGLGLSFDKEIFEVTLDYLKNDNQEKLAKWLEEHTPSKHKENINFTYNDKEIENSDQFVDLRKKHIELLSKFDNYCNKYGIKYFGDGGTVLGAVRHGGLIPWDDDIDVVMTHDNYNKFIKTINKFPIEGMKFVSIENTPNYTIHFGRLYDLSSFRVYYTDSLLTSSYGYHLDIFVLDEYIENKKIRDIHEKLHRIFGQTLNPSLNMFDKNYSKPCKRIESLIKVIGRKNYIKLMTKILYSNRGTKSNKYVVRWRKRYVYKKSLYDEQIYVPFENIKVPIPKNYVEYLNINYGENWFVYPLDEERKDIDKIFNLYVPYNLYQDDFLSFIDVNETNDAYHNLKYMKMQRVNLNKKVEDAKIKNQFYKDKLELENKIDISIVDKLFKSNNFWKVREYLSDYYYLQLKASLRDRNLLFILDKTFLYQSIFVLIMTDEFYDARKLLNIKKVKDILSEEYDSLITLIDYSKNIIYENDTKIKELYKKYPYSLTFAVEYFKRIKETGEKIKVVDVLSEKYENCGQVLYLDGLCKIKSRKIEDGIKILQLAKKKIRNGLIIFDIDKILNKYNEV